MAAETLYRDAKRIAFPGMRTERLINTRYYRHHPESQRRLLRSAYGVVAMFRRRYRQLRKERISILIALVRALTAKRIEQKVQVHHTYQPPRVLHTQRY